MVLIVPWIDDVWRKMLRSRWWCCVVLKVCTVVFLFFFIISSILRIFNVIYKYSPLEYNNSSSNPLKILFFLKSALAYLNCYALIIYHSANLCFLWLLASVLQPLAFNFYPTFHNYWLITRILLLCFFIFNF